MGKWTIFVLNSFSRVWRPSRHICTHTFLECSSPLRWGGGGSPRLTCIYQTSPRELQHLHACKLRAIWRIYAQNAREKQACKIRQSLSYTQYACICHREISSPLLLHTSCVFLKADLKEVVKCWSIIGSSHSNFSMKCMYWSVCLKVDYSK